MRIKFLAITLCIFIVLSALLQPTLLPLLRPEVVKSQRLRSNNDDDEPPVAITFVISTAASPIHPSTCIIDETIASIPKEFPVVIGADVCDPKQTSQSGGNNDDATRCQRYESYKNALYEKYVNFTTRAATQHNVLIAETPSNATGNKLVRNLRNALSLVSTEFVVIVQDDMPFLNYEAIPFTDIVGDMLMWDNLTYVSFSMMGRGSNDPEFDIMITGHAEVVGSSYIGPSSNTSTTSYMTTSIWTDNNFICRANYMRSLLASCKAPFPEWCQMAAIRKDNYTWDAFQTWRYGAKGSAPTIYHLDGRNSKKCRNITTTATLKPHQKRMRKR